MIEKALTEAGWKKFADGRGLQDAALRKGLAALAKAEKAGADAQQKALDEIDKQLEALRKAHKADKALAAQLTDVDKALRAQRKAAEEEARAAAKAAAEAEDDDGEEETPALLTTKMKPLLKQVQKGDTVHALIALAGKDLAVLLAKKSISPARRKLLTDHLGVSGGVKFVVGQCLFEDKAHTFVVQTQAAGLAKRLKAALYEQTEMRVKVRVRGLDPKDVDDDGDDEADADEDTPAKPDANEEQPEKAPLDEATALQAEYARVKQALYAKLSATVREGGEHKDLILNLMGKAMKAERAEDWQEALAIYGQLEDLVGPPDAPAEAEPDDGDLKERYEELLAELEPLLAAALKAQQGDVSRMRATSQFAREKARSGDFEAALKSLQTLARLLGVDAGQASAAPAPDPGKAFNARLAALMPRIRKAIADGGESGTEAKLKASEAGVFARKKDFAAADALLDALEALLGGGAEPAAAAESEADDDFDVAAFRRRWAIVRQGWQDSLDTVDGQIGRLQSVLKDSDDPELRQIADSGLASLTGSHRTPLTAAMLDIERAGSGERLKKAIRKADLIAGDFDRHLRDSDAVRVTDDNGFGVAVTIRDSLGGALRRMQNLLASV